MIEFFDPKGPATLESVLRAVTMLSQHSEAELAEKISRGQLSSLFPFRPRETLVPDDFEDDGNVREASAMPSDEEGYAALVRSSMPPPRSAAQIEAAARTLGVRKADLERALQVMDPGGA